MPARSISAVSCERTGAGMGLRKPSQEEIAGTIHRLFDLIAPTRIRGGQGDLQLSSRRSSQLSCRGAKGWRKQRCGWRHPEGVRSCISTFNISEMLKYKT